MILYRRFRYSVPLICASRIQGTRSGHVDSYFCARGSVLRENRLLPLNCFFRVTQTELSTYLCFVVGYKSNAIVARPKML